MTAAGTEFDFDKIRWIYFGLMIGMFTASISMTIVGPAIPRIVADLGGVQYYAWLSTIVMLVSAIVVPPNSVARIDEKGKGVESFVGVGRGPTAIAVGAGGVWVANAEEGSVTRLDPATGKFVATIGTGADVSDIAVGFGSVGEFSTGFPGYTAFVPDDCAPLPRILRDNGYATSAFGKWHLTPDGQQGPAGPFNRWPTGWG